MARSAQFEVCILRIMPVTSESSGWLGIPHLAMVTTNVKVIWGFPTQFLSRADSHAGLMQSASYFPI
jgi:hypothetical protein